ncbi:MAG: galactose-1-phosphate uridylyltransferase [Candidatus Bathyarchaeota archaeon]|jgi:UDPglucose--hexose-1-phosphate uridylyltransferase|nr:galactose-1-phosphate uridylyltransferase [Candidatus Bathyarchaeota archaeon A05DMB-3]MDH7607109.1 galactose-1-phosphate uridylyltransferase [Candidatus Bathyarchaeota archaeon]
MSAGVIGMPYNELRKDYLLDRWVVIATERGRRPTDFAKREKTQAKKGVCPFCPGNEHMTPPAVLAYIESGGKIEKIKDEDDFRHKNWIIRCFSNLFPAFNPPQNTSDRKNFMKSCDLALAVGHHEVLVESPNHDKHPSDASVQQLVHVVNAYLDRLFELSSKPYVKYVSIFRNHGLEAGASLSHAHSQIIATPFVPKIVEEEMKASRKFWQEHGECVFCNIIKRERESPRFIMENMDFVVFAPWASVNPMEFWILPKRHAISPLELSKGEKEGFAKMLKTCFSALKTLLNDPPYNFGFHIALGKTASQHYHWHLEVYPKLAIWAGFEKSTGVYINTVTPETAAESLRKEISP